MFSMQTSVDRQDQTLNSFVEYLRRELAQRLNSNRSYSLRSFARDLDVSPTSLSSLLSGKRSISIKMIQRLALKLRLSPAMTQRFLNHQLGTKLSGESEFKDLVLREDQFKMLSDWKHFAILRLIKTFDFQPNEKWIANRLNSSQVQIQDCKNRLIRCGLLKVEKTKWIDISNGATQYLKTSDSDTAIRSFLRSMIELSMESLESDSINLRNHTGMMMTISRESLPLAKALITDFRRSLTEMLETDKSKKQEVYYLELGLFPLTRSKKTETN